MDQSDILSATKTLNGQDAADQCLEAAESVSNAIKTSFGALGLDKICIDASGDITITNDGATILKNMKLDHPAAMLVAELAQSQDYEQGDGTTGVVLTAVELIKRGNQIIKDGLHPSTVVKGYMMAYKECVKIINEDLVTPLKFDHIDEIMEELKNIENIKSESMKIIINIIKTTISSKVISGESDKIIEMILNSIFRIRKISFNGIGDKVTYPINRISLLKKQGQQMRESFWYPGLTINCNVASMSMKNKLNNPKVALLGFGLKKKRLPLGTKVKIENPDDLEDIRRKEEEICIEQTKNLLKAGANLIVTEHSIEDSCIKLITDANAIAIKFVRSVDIKNIAESLKISILNTEDVEYNSELSSKFGEAEAFEVTKAGDSPFCLLKMKNAASLVLRGPNEALLEEMERSINDALSAVRSALESETILPGGGATEIALNIRLENLAKETFSRENIAIYEFANSLLKTLQIVAENGGLDPNFIKSEIFSAQKELKKVNNLKISNIGFDVFTSKIQDNILNGIVEPSGVKLNALRSAVEAAISVLRIRSVIFVPEKAEESKDQCGSH